MISDVDVFGACVKLARFGVCESYSTLIVTVKGDWVVKRMEEFRDQLFDPNSFLGSVSERDIFSLGRREGDKVLFA
jgi:hypothetical protein